MKIKTRQQFLHHPVQFAIIVLTMLAIFAMAGQAFAGGPLIDNSTNLKQKQDQFLVNDPVTNVETKYQDERQLAPVFVAPPGFGASVSSNSCAGTEAWSIGIGGAFFVPNGTGAPVSAGIGGGASDVITLNLCEVREAANLANSMGDRTLALQILAQHPAAYRAMQALGMKVNPVAAYEMEVVTEDSPNVVTTTTTRTVASRGPSYCEIYQPCWNN